jgi:hypothetical protein
MKKRNNVKEQTKLSFQLGGTTPMSGTGVINTPANVSTTGFTPYVAPTIPGFTKPQLQNTQYTTATQTTNLPTFLQTVGTKPGEYDELRRYVNDAGQVRQIPFKNGQPIYPIPEGYRFEAEDTTQVIEATTGPVANVGQQQQDDGGGDGGGGTGVSGSVQGPAGGTTGLAGVQSALSGVTGYFSGKPAQAQPYGGTTLSGLTNLGTITDFSNNISGVQDALGVYGTGPVNLGIVGSMLMGNPLGALASASGIGPSTEAFGQAAPTGHGAYSTANLEAYATGKMSKAQQNELGISMNQNQAQARAQVQRAIGTPITGIVGYKKGDISPITGTPVNSKGRVVNFNGSSRGVDPGFETMGGWMDAMKASVSSGYYGGPLSKDEVANLSEKGKKGYAAKAKELGYDPQGEGPPGSGGPAAEAGSYGTPPGGTGKGRSDYTGGNAGTPSGDIGVGSPGGSSVSGQETAGSPGAESNNDSPGGGYGSDSGGAGGAGDMGVICLTEDMKVKRNGVIDFVTKVQVGDIIDNTVVTEVLHKHMREGYYKVNGELKITNDHPVLANGSWKRTEDLVLGDYINNVEVTSLEYVEQVTPTVYIGTVEDRYDVYTEGEVYTVHGQYKNALKKAA